MTAPKSNAGRKPLPSDQKKNTKNIFLTTPQEIALIKKYGSLTNAILTVNMEVSAINPDYSGYSSLAELEEAKGKMEASIKIFGEMGLPTYQTEYHLQLVNEQILALKSHEQV